MFCSVRIKFYTAVFKGVKGESNEMLLGVISVKTVSVSYHSTLNTNKLLLSSTDLNSVIILFTALHCIYSVTFSTIKCRAVHVFVRGIN